MSRGRQCPPEIREGAMVEFVDTWQDYSSPSAAAAVVEEKWGVGRTTLSEWLRHEGLWPYTRVAANLRLAAENVELKRRFGEVTGGSSDD